MDGKKLEIWLMLSEPETGKWCDECRLPSAVRYLVHGVTETGFLGPFGSMIRCSECYAGGREVAA